MPVLVRVPEYLSTSTSTSTITLVLMSTSTVRVQEIQYSSTASTSTEYEYPSPDPWILQKDYRRMTRGEFELLRWHCIRPTEPHALAWGLTNFHTKIFQLERHRLKISEKIIDSLSNFTRRFNAHSPTCCVNFTDKIHMVNPELFRPPLANAAGFVVLRPCWLNSDLLSGPKGNYHQVSNIRGTSVGN